MEDRRGELVEQLAELEAEATELEETAKMDFREKLAELTRLQAAMAVQGAAPSDAAKSPETAQQKKAARLAQEASLWKQLALGKDQQGAPLDDESRAKLQCEAEALVEEAAVMPKRRRHGGKTAEGDKQPADADEQVEMDEDDEPTA